MVVVSETREWHGMTPLRACEWAPSVTSVTSGLGKKRKKKEGTTTKHHPLLLTLPWEHICPAAATAKHSGKHPDTWSMSFPKPLQLGAAGEALSVCAKWDRLLLLWSEGGGRKLLQLSLAPEVGMGHCHWRYLNQNHLQPQPPPRAPQRRTL